MPVPWVKKIARNELEKCFFGKVVQKRKKSLKKWPRPRNYYILSFTGAILIEEVWYHYIL